MISTYHVGDRMILDMRDRLNFLLTNCYRYMKKHEPEKFKTECAFCKFIGASEEVNGDRCGMETIEYMRIGKMLRGIGITDRHHKRRKGTFLIRNRGGRIVFAQEKRSRP